MAAVAFQTTVALPSYNDYIRRGQLPEAFAGMADHMVNQADAG